MVSLADLPDEIIELVVSYFSIKELKRIAGLPVIGNQALQRLHSKVFIVNNYVSNTDDSVISFYLKVPYFSVSEYLELIDSNPFISPKEIVFLKAATALHMARIYPEYLKRAKIALTQDITEYEDMELFSIEFQKTPFTVDSVDAIFIPFIKEFYPIQLAKNVSSLCLYTSKDSASRLLRNDYLNLTSFSTDLIICDTEIKTIPRTMQTLSCSITWSGEESENAKLDFPNSLKELDITVAINRRILRQENVVDISHLTDLRKLSVHGNEQKFGSFRRWIVSPSIKFLSIYWPDIIYGGISASCPYLVDLKIKIDPKFAFQLLPQKLNVPETLQRLDISANFLYCPRQVASVITDVVRSKFELPSSLKELRIKGLKEPRVVTFVDFEKSQFHSLDKLEIKGVYKLNILGDIPVTLSRLKLERVRNFNFNELAYLSNLRELDINNICQSVKFSYHLPKLLRNLSITNCGISKVYLCCAGLLNLVLDNNDFKVLSKDNFVIPDTLIELLLLQNNISKTDVDFPKDLETLMLDFNKLENINGLPKSLKILNLSHNLLGEYENTLVFPKNLEELDLSNNNIKNEWLRNLSLVEFNKLRYLLFSQNKLQTFNPACLPKSLVKLDLSSNTISSFIGDFRNLAVQRLWLGSNKLSKYFSSRKNQDTFLGSSIRYVALEGNGLLNSDLEPLLSTLSNNPKFEAYDVEQEECEFVYYLGGGRPRKIRKLDQ